MSLDLSNLTKGLDAARQKMLVAATGAVDRFGEQVLGDAQGLAPVATGFLQGSATTTPAALDGTGVEKTIGFNAHYAAPVHENLEASHAVGEAKFLENALRESANKFMPYVGKAINQITGD